MSLRSTDDTLACIFRERMRRASRKMPTLAYLAGVRDAALVEGNARYVMFDCPNKTWIGCCLPEYIPTSNVQDGYNSTVPSFPSRTNLCQSALHSSIRCLTPCCAINFLMNRSKASSSSATKYDERRERIDSNVALGAERRSGN